MSDKTTIFNGLPKPNREPIQHEGYQEKPAPTKHSEKYCKRCQWNIEDVHADTLSDWVNR